MIERTLLAPGLVVVLDRDAALRLDPAHMGERIIIGVDPRVQIPGHGRVGGVQDVETIDLVVIGEPNPDSHAVRRGQYVGKRFALSGGELLGIG